jgi:hypothetical protein
MPHPNTEEISSFSRCSVYLRLFFQEELLARATGLLAHTAAGSFLITALHNFTGREPDGRCKSSTGGVPNFVEVTGDYFQARLPLYDEDNNPNTCGYQFWRHPLGPQMDVAALPIRQGVYSASALHASFLHPTQHAATVKLFVSQLCFVVGYPEGLFVRQSPQSVLPIWKTGHIASEPSVYLDDLPKLLIDVATCEGMSGSPVFVSNEDCNRLVGIYTGRTSQVSELGFVFTPEVILKIISTGSISGRLEYPAT